MMKIGNQTAPPALKKLGYTTPQIDDIVKYIDEQETIEGAPHLLERDLPVFDCAFKAQKGERSIHYMGHIKMMGATQPFISGAISKTVNVPKNATVEDIEQAYIDAWRLGAKAVSIYRDGSKRTQPLNTSRDKQVVAADTGADALAAAPQPVRRRLPDERQSITHKFDIAGHEGYITVGLYEDGQPGELFLTMAKEGSTIGGLMDTVATLTSLALQYGVPLESLVKKFAYQRFEPSGFTKNPDIRNATSITDYIFRWLGCQFIKGYKEATSPSRMQPDLPMKEIADIEKKALNRPVAELPRTAEKEIIDVITSRSNSEGTPESLANGNGLSKTHADRVREALGSMYMGITCSNCGSTKVIRAGACGVCTDCGTSQGCS